MNFWNQIQPQEDGAYSSCFYGELSGAGDLTLVMTKLRLALKHSKKQLQEVFRVTLTVRSLQADKEAGLRALGHQYRWASNSPASLPHTNQRSR